MTRTTAQSPSPASSTTVFIGHGGKSKEWLVLSRFLEKTLSLDVDEFDRTSTAGVAVTTRLEEMLDAAQLAFLVMTGEDGTGASRARLNVSTRSASSRAD